MATDVFVHPFVILAIILEEPCSIQEVSPLFGGQGSGFTHEAWRGMRGATGSVVRFLFRDAGRTGEVGTAAVGADKEVAAEDEADGVVAVPEPEGCLIGVDEAMYHATIYSQQLLKNLVSHQLSWQKKEKVRLLVPWIVFCNMQF